MSHPTFVSAEIGDVDATTVVVTFDQNVDLAEEIDADAKVLTAAKYGEYLIPSGKIARPGK